MRFFGSQILIPYILDYNYQDILEIGSSMGGNSDQILRKIPKIKISIIDPCVHTDLIEKYKKNQRVELLKGLSLEVLPRLKKPFDCILIDGDHNYYTVYNELKEIHSRGLLKQGGTIFLHDVQWPYARRDMYYDPTNIPKEHLRSHSKKGMIRGRSELAEDGGANVGANNVLYEGGPENGVLTAVEDFLAPKKNQYGFFASRSEHGLGVIVKEQILSPVFLAWYWKMKLFDFKVLLHPLTKKIKSSINV